MEYITSLCSQISRRKHLSDDVMQTPLKRCLNTFDLTLIGIGNIVGAGVFILTGELAKNKAGPGIVVSYILSGFAVTLSALCYAEFGARVPRAGSAYTYTYVTLGELWAFIIGWDIILEGLLGTAAVAKGWSSVFDAMFSGIIRNTTIEYFGEINATGLGHYPDFVATAILLLVILVELVGAKHLARASTALTIPNVLAILIIVGLCFAHADWTNWTSASLGGFLPYGFTGTIEASATLFYAYCGFDSITAGGEEASNPTTQVPRATLITMATVTVLYICAGASLTLMVPFSHIDESAAFTVAFQSIGLDWAVYVVSIGALLGITSTLFGALFGLPRTVYAMASDGIFFECFAYVHPRTQTPIIATAVTGIISAILALLVDYITLVEFLAIGSLTSFTMVAVGIIIYRYCPQYSSEFVDTGEQLASDSESTSIITSAEGHNQNTASLYPELRKECVDFPVIKNHRGDKVLYVALLTIVCCTTLGAVVMKVGGGVGQTHRDWWKFTILSVAVVGILLSLTVISAYKERVTPESFKVPLVPYLPVLSVMINIVLLVQLPPLAWARFAVWIALGMVIYFGYSRRHSKENDRLADSSLHLTTYSSLD